MKHFVNNFYQKTLGLILKKSAKVSLLLVMLFAFSTSLAQVNPNVKTATYTDISPGVTGTLNVTVETISEELGNIAVRGKLKYDFPPQPKNITLTIKNVDGKGSFKDFVLQGTTDTIDNIDIVFTNIPLDKSSRTKTLATKDRFLITSKVDKGTDFFFAGNATYLNFNLFQANSAQPPAPTKPTQVVISSGEPHTSSVVVTDLKALSPTKAQIELAVITSISRGTPLPAYIVLAWYEKGVLVSHTTTEWKEIEDPDAPRDDGQVLGASKHPFTVEKGKAYDLKVWLATKASAKPEEGRYSTTLLIDSDYLFGKKISNTAPGLKPVDQKALNNVWDSITGTFVPGSIEFFRVGTGETVVPASKDAYIFLARIPGLENTTKIGADGKPYPAFDPTIEGSFSRYVSIFINMIYGLIALLAVINIVHYGFNLMVRSATPFERKEDKKMIFNSFIAITIALGSYLLLNTINPKLTNWGLNVNQVSVDGAQLDFEAALEQELVENPTAVTDLSKYVLEGTFANPKPSNASVKTCADKLNAGEKVSKIEVKAVSPNSPENKMFIFTNSGLCTALSVNIGAGGTTVWPKSEAKKTPKGANGPEKGGKSITQQGRTRLPKSNMEPAICTGSNNKKFNCGAAFIETGITNSKGELRFIGIHGQGNNKLGTTAGCIRMKNDDLVLLAKHLVGVDLYIK